MSDFDEDTYKPTIDVSRPLKRRGTGTWDLAIVWAGSLVSFVLFPMAIDSSAISRDS